MNLTLKINRAFQLYSVWKIAKKLFKKKKEVVVKKGISTTEMWLTAGFDLLAIGMTIIGTLNPALTVKVLLIANSVYAVSRTLVKLTATELDDKAVEKLKELIDKK